MIELKKDALRFSFPEVHPSASLTIDFQRTLRIPDNDEAYSLPPGLGRFPLRHVDDYATALSPAWIEHGGVMLPMHQAEAMWLRFESHEDYDRGVGYPFAVRIAAGKISAVTGQQWTKGIHKKPQDYVVVPRQPWLDGFCVTKGIISQFVAMPLGTGYSAEEQITGAAEHGGVQIEVYPMKREAFEDRFLPVTRMSCFTDDDLLDSPPPAMCSAPSMGLSAGGRMRQEIYDDPFAFDDWDRGHSLRCFVHLANSTTWRALTGEAPPTRSPTAAQYTAAGLPWFDYYGEGTALAGSPILAGLESVAQLGKKKGETPLPENEPVHGETIVKLRAGLRQDQVREGRF